MVLTVELVSQVIVLVAGLLGMPIVEFFKRHFQVAGNVALGVALGVSFVLAAAVAFATGQVSAVPVSIEEVGSLWAVVFSIATVFYKLFVGDKR